MAHSHDFFTQLPYSTEYYFFHSYPHSTCVIFSTMKVIGLKNMYITITRPPAIVGVAPYAILQVTTVPVKT